MRIRYAHAKRSGVLVPVCAAGPAADAIGECEWFSRGVCEGVGCMAFKTSSKGVLSK